jgi:hypothetical protein
MSETESHTTPETPKQGLVAELRKLLFTIAPVVLGGIGALLGGYGTSYLNNRDAQNKMFNDVQELQEWRATIDAERKKAVDDSRDKAYLEGAKAQNDQNLAAEVKKQGEKIERLEAGRR